LVKKGEDLMAPDAPRPIAAVADLCLVKLLVGPGVTSRGRAIPPDHPISRFTANEQRRIADPKSFSTPGDHA
jgi:hypothetical protein